MSEHQPLYASPASDESEVARTIRVVCNDICQMLLVKNARYGNSAIEPLRIFSRADPLAQIDVRIDDKLSRIAARQADDDEDPERDLLGYLILKQVALRMRAKPPGNGQGENPEAS